MHLDILVVYVIVFVDVRLVCKRYLQWFFSGVECLHEVVGSLVRTVERVVGAALPVRFR